MSITFKKRSCIIFAIILLFSVWAAPHAAAVALVDDAVAVVALALGAFGLTMDVAAWGTGQSWLQNKMDAYAELNGKTLLTWISDWAIGISHTGNIVANVAAAGAIAAFAAWLVGNEGFVDNATQLVSMTSGYFFQDGTPLEMTVYDATHRTIVSVGNFFMIGQHYLINGHDTIVYLDSVNNKYILDVDNVNYFSVNAGNVANFNYYSWGIRESDVNSNLDVAGLAIHVFRSLDNTDWAYNTRWDLSSQYRYRTIWGETSTDQVSVTTGVIDVPTAGEMEDAGLVINAGFEAGTTWNDAIAGIQTGIVAGTLSPTASITAAADIPEVLPNLGSAGDYQVTGLAEVFPFCIPFDLYNFFSVLAAEPVAPHFEIPFEIDGLVDYTFVIDLEAFDDVAAILRTMELLLFIVGLILLTRNIIRG